MLLKLFTNQKILCFIGGAVAATAGVRALKSDKVRKACVKAMAKGMRLQVDAKEAFQNMREEAEDICADAKREVGG